MKKFLCFAASIFLTSAALAQERPPQTSLFLTPQEEHEAEMLARRSAPPGKGDLHVGAVLYYGPGDWTVWIQGEKWTPGTRREGLEILEVTESEVRLLWTNPEDNKPLELSLHPNEAYRVATGRVVSER